MQEQKKYGHFWDDKKMVARLVGILRENLVLKKFLPWILGLAVIAILVTFWLVRRPILLGTIEEQIQMASITWQHELPNKGDRIFAQESWERCFKAHECGNYGALISERINQPLIQNLTHQDAALALLSCILNEHAFCFTKLLTPPINENDLSPVLAPILKHFEAYCLNPFRSFCLQLSKISLDEGNGQHADYLVEKGKEENNPFYYYILRARIEIFHERPQNAPSFLMRANEFASESQRAFNLNNELSRNEYKIFAKNVDFLQVKKDCEAAANQIAKKMQSAFDQAYQRAKEEQLKKKMPNH